MTENLHLIVRHQNLDDALAAARRLSARYGALFAVVRDEAGYGPSFVSPYAVVAAAAPYRARLDAAYGTPR